MADSLSGALRGTDEGMKHMTSPWPNGERRTSAQKRSWRQWAEVEMAFKMFSSAARILGASAATTLVQIHRKTLPQF